MEYRNTYLDDEEIPHMDQDQSQQQHDGRYLLDVHEATETRAAQHEQPPQQQPPPHHGVVDEEELLAAQAAADAAVAQQQQHGTPGGVFSNVAQGLVGKDRDLMMQYWQETINSIEHDEHDFKNHQLPLARIKKVMKTDEDVRMISAEAPILFAKGCDVFITELTMRAWIHAEENKRRTLQKSDIAAALTKSDMFDFLIDVVPREEEKPKKSYQARVDGFSSAPGSAHIGHSQELPASHGQPHLRGPSIGGNSQVVSAEGLGISNTSSAGGREALGAPVGISRLPEGDNQPGLTPVVGHNVPNNIKQEGAAKGIDPQGKRPYFEGYSSYDSGY